SVFKTLGAQHDLDEAADARRRLIDAVSPQTVLSAFDVDEGIVRRLVDAAIFPELLSREMATALLDTTDVNSVVVFVESSSGELRIVTAAGCDTTAARSLARGAHQGSKEHEGDLVLIESLGRDHDGPRRCVLASRLPLTELAMARFKMFTA